MIDENEIDAFKARQRQQRYVHSDKGAAARQRYLEEVQQGYALLRAQGVPSREAKKPARARKALRDLLAAEFARQAQEGGDS